MRHWTLLFAALLCACGPAGVGGSVDGERVGGASDAFYDSLRLDFGPFGEFEVLVVMITDFDDGCEALADFFTTAAVGCDDLCEEYVDLAGTYGLRGDDAWALALSANVSNGIDGEFTFDEDLGEGEFNGDFFGWDTTPLSDLGECEDTCDDGDLLDADVDGGQEGTLELSEDGDRIKGTFDLQLGGDDGVSGRFTARECDMGDWVWFL